MSKFKLEDYPSYMEIAISGTIAAAALVVWIGIMIVLSIDAIKWLTSYF